MDLLLERFLTDCYPTLSETDRRAFERLLDEPDLDIMSWITGRCPCPERTYLTCLGQLQRLQVPGAAPAP